ncbi:hypothetical protein L7F22_019554 [Adiantum nelumboides]|nr:hypothetical protein [Adiantum nelumboides]
MAGYSSSPSQDLTAAWYAAAPPPPPPQSKVPSKRASMAVQPTYSNHSDRLRTSSSSTSLSFDKRTMGDDLPRDSHSPAPERPVSRNAMARQRERERQRARTNSTSGQPDNESYHQMNNSAYESHHLHTTDTLPNRSPSPGPRNRRESSPAAAGQWSTYHPEQNVQHQGYNPQAGQNFKVMQQNGDPMAPPPVTQAYPPSTTVMQQPVPSYGTVWAAPPPTSPSPVPQYYSPAPQQFVQQSPMQPPLSQPQYNGYPAGYVSAPQTPSQFVQGHWPQANGQQHPVYVAEPMPMSQTPPVYAGTPVVNNQGQWIAPQQQNAPVPFPTSTAMPPPPVPVNQFVNGYGQVLPQQHGYPTSAYGTPPIANGRPLPSPSRTSSQSSSVGTRTSTTSLGSISGTVRRTLPQPPQGRSDSNPQPIISGHTTVRQSDIPASLGRHESVRMAAEEIMSRGMPNRRKGVPSSMRTQSNASSVQTHANSSRSDGSITDGSLPGIGPKPSTPVPVTSRNRAESASCLENEMRSMKLQDNESRHASLRSNRTPFAPVQPSINGQQHVSVPASQSNEPVRASSPRPIRAAPTPDPDVTINSPMEDIIPRRPISRGPKDERERRRSMEIQAATAAAAKSSQIPSITVDDGPMIPRISFDEPIESQPAVPTIVMPGEEDENGGPSIQISEAPQICISEEYEAEKPTGTISISVSSAGLAQRSTSSNNVQSQAGQGNLSRQRTASKPFAAPAPASAPSIGSGAACATCQKWIGGRVVHAMSHTFHPDCFVCSYCSEALEHVAFYEHEGRPYCHFDFHELFSKRCFHCRTPIVDQRYITINDVELIGNDGTGETQERCYHDMHFFCANCGDPFLDPKLASSAAGAENAITTEIEDEDGHVRFGGREFVVHKGYPYCEHCHVSLHKPKCKGCKKPIIDEEYLTALRGKWHIGCFCCQRCQHPIDSDNFFVRDGQAYDEECYKIKLRSEL